MCVCVCACVCACICARVAVLGSSCPEGSSSHYVYSFVELVHAVLNVRVTSKNCFLKVLPLTMAMLVELVRDCMNTCALVAFFVLVAWVWRGFVILNIKVPKRSVHNLMFYASITHIEHSYLRVRVF